MHERKPGDDGPRPDTPPHDEALLARLATGARRNENTGCLEWRRMRHNGYGYMNYRGKSRRVHRLAYEAHFGPIPTGLLVCHACDNPCCLAIEHLFLGTPKQNVEDMHRKGRARPVGRVLCEPLVAEMKRRFLMGRSVREVADTFRLSYATAYGVKIGEFWKRVAPAAGAMDMAALAPLMPAARAPDQCGALSSSAFIPGASDDVG
jgi:hypothetical protein